MLAELPTVTAAPVAQQERITILDSLRGVAILGILLMNVPGFGLPYAQAGDPSILNETGLNFQAWYLVEGALSGTQRAIFSMLFGAGVILFIARLEKRMTGIDPAIYFFRRQMWLLAFGLFDAFVLLWFWDILYAYAIFGMFLFVFYRSSPKKLMILAGVCLVLMTARENVDLYRNKNVITKGEQVALIDTTSRELTAQEKDQLGALKGLKEKASLESRIKSVEKEIRGVQGNYASVYETLSDKSVHVELHYTYFLAWDIFLFMFLGMAFYKNEILLGKASNTLYWIFFVGGITLGWLSSYLNQKTLIDNNFNDYEVAKNVSFQFYQVGRVLRSLGVFGLLMVMYKSGVFNWFFALFRPVGQMAFTNYLMQSLIGLLFFTGIGLGYFGKLERYELYIYVAVIWVIEIIWSHIWLRYNRFGPMELLWRRLTYWKKTI